MAIFSFAHPQYLFLLFAIPLVFLIHFLALGSKRKNALRFANFDAIARIEGIDFFSKNVVLLLLNVVIICSLIFALSGFTLHTTAQTSEFSFVIALDSSQSMEANDMSPNRLTASKRTINDFIDYVPVDVRIGIISFAGSTTIHQDLTERKDEIKRGVNEIRVGNFGGTDIYEAVLTGTNLLKNEAHKAIILVSDGQINVGNIDDAIDYANDNDVIVHSVGIGTEEGGQTSIGFSKLDEDSLKSISYNTNGAYFRAVDEKNMTNIFLGVLDLTERKVSIELMDYLLLFAVILLIFEFFLSNTKYVSLP